MRRSGERWQMLGAAIVGAAIALMVPVWQEKGPFLQTWGYLCIAGALIGFTLLLVGFFMPDPPTNADGRELKPFARDVRVIGDVTINQPHSVEDMADVAERVFHEKISEITEVATSVAVERAQQLVTAFLDELNTREPGALDRPSTPAMADALIEAQEQFALSGDADLEFALVEDLVQKASRTHRATRTLGPLAVGVAAFVVVLAASGAGYLVAANRSTVAGLDMTARAGIVTIHYPRSWVQAPSRPWMIAPHQIALVPRGAARYRGVFVGTALGSPPTYLSTQFRNRLRNARLRPTTVKLRTYVALRFAARARGYGTPLVIYVIPTATANVIATCIGGSALAQACTAIVGTIRITARTADPRPSAAFGRRLSAVLNRFVKDRRARLRKLQSAKTSRAQATAARFVAAAYSSATQTVSKLDCPLPAKGPCSRILRGTREGTAAFTALASAARTRDADRYAAARSKARTADAMIRQGSASLEQIGYVVAAARQ